MTPTPLEDYVKLATSFPETTFILAHWGGGLPFFELNQQVRGTLSNIYYDTAASPLIYEPSIFRRVIDLIGPEPARIEAVGQLERDPAAIEHDPDDQHDEAARHGEKPIGEAQPRRATQLLESWP